jgi:hypothetical protein
MQRYTIFFITVSALEVSGGFSAHHQELKTVHTASGICQACLLLPQVPSWSCSKAVYKPVWHIPLPSVQRINSWWWTEELFETCRVSCQNKFVILVHLVGFIIKGICQYLWLVIMWVPIFVFTPGRFAFFSSLQCSQPSLTVTLAVAVYRSTWYHKGSNVSKTFSVLFFITQAERRWEPRSLCIYPRTNVTKRRLGPEDKDM